jgi:superfamily II DNA or RNA helicase
MSHARLRPGTAVRIRRQRWRVVQIVTHARAAVLDVAGADAANRGTRATFLLPAERVESLDTVARPRAVSASRWQRLARGLLGHALARYDSLRAAASAQISLIPFQLEPALALAQGIGVRMLIADEVGLGKTIQAGLVAAEILSRHAEARVLIVTPAALRDQWAAELDARFALRAEVLDGRALADVASSPHVNPWAIHPVVVTSIDFVKRPEVLRSLDSLVWDLAIFDEAHALCGTSERASAADGIARRSRRVVLLSATPHSGDDQAFGRLCRIGALGDDPLLVFRRTRRDAGLPAGRRTTLLRVTPSAAELAMHRTLQEYARRIWRDSTSGAASRLAVAVLLKRACSGATALSRSLERRLRLLTPAGPPLEAQLALPFVASDEDAEPMSVLGAIGLSDREDECRQLESLIALAQTAARSETKFAALHRLLRRVQQPVLVFTEYRDTLAHLVAATPVASVQIHGGLTTSERRAAVQAFTHGEARVLFATDAASEGLNLQRRCRLVVTLELPWSPVRLEQRIGRVDRIGQRDRVHAVHLLAAGTPEEEVVSRLTCRQSRGRAWFASAGAVRDEEVAGAIVSSLTGPDVTTPDAEAPGNHGLLFPDRRVDALAEAQRLTTCRTLLAGAGDELPGRPVVALVPSRRTGPRGRIWACAQIPFVDRTDRVHWRIVAAVEASSPSPVASISPAGWLWSRLTPDAYPVVAARSSVEPWVHRSMVREHALAADLQKRHGRLAAYQAGLFDRRAERRIASQSAELDEALRRCRERLQLLESLRDAAPGTPEPVFTVVRR